MSSNKEVLEALRWKKFPVLNDGFVCLVDVMGDDSAIVQAARTSYGNGTRPVSDDKMLIRYLLRHRHTTPFEMAEVKLMVRVPMDTWRQWIRHRTASVNEYSTRYSIAIDSMSATKPEAWRIQAVSNRQGSEGLLPPDQGEELTRLEREFQRCARECYERRLELGVAREQARKDLPLSTYTEAYWKCDMHNLLHFLALRMEKHAQEEIREYARIIGEEIICPLFPLTWGAFKDYCLNSLELSALDQGVIQRIAKMGNIPADEETFLECQDSAWSGLARCRERDECREKLQRLGLVR